MSINCAVLGCKNSSNMKGIQFFPFPLNKSTLLSQWLAISGQKDWFPKSSSRICSQHFTKDSFIIRPNLSPPRLKVNAIPSLHIGTILNNKISTNIENVNDSEEIIEDVESKESLNQENQNHPFKKLKLNIICNASPSKKVENVHIVTNNALFKKHECTERSKETFIPEDRKRKSQRIIRPLKVDDFIFYSKSESLTKNEHNPIIITESKTESEKDSGKSNLKSKISEESGINRTIIVNPGSPDNEKKLISDDNLKDFEDFEIKIKGVRTGMKNPETVSVRMVVVEKENKKICPKETGKPGTAEIKANNKSVGENRRREHDHENIENQKIISNIKYLKERNISDIETESSNIKSHLLDSLSELKASIPENVNSRSDESTSKVFPIEQEQENKKKQSPEDSIYDAFIKFIQVGGLREKTKEEKELEQTSERIIEIIRQKELIKKIDDKEKNLTILVTTLPKIEANETLVISKKLDVTDNTCLNRDHKENGSKTTVKKPGFITQRVPNNLDLGTNKKDWDWNILPVSFEITSETCNETVKIDPTIKKNRTQKYKSEDDDANNSQNVCHDDDEYMSSDSSPLNSTDIDENTVEDGKSLSSNDVLFRTKAFKKISEYKMCIKNRNETIRKQKEKIRWLQNKTRQPVKLDKHGQKIKKNKSFEEPENEYIVNSTAELIESLDLVIKSNLIDKTRSQSDKPDEDSDEDSCDSRSSPIRYICEPVLIHTEWQSA